MKKINIVILFMFLLYSNKIFAFDLNNQQSVRELKSLPSQSIPCLYFNSNMNEMAPEMRQKLELLAKVLSESGAIVEVRGHTDLKGSDEYNLRLSRERAEMVKGYLIERGVRRDKIFARGYGEKFPLCHEDSENCDVLNRRVEIVVMGWKNE